MQSTGFQELEGESRSLYKTLQEMPISAVSFRDIQPIERYISLLKKKSNFLASKLQVVHLSAAQTTAKPPNESYDVTENKLEYANEILKKNMQEKELKTAMLNSFLTTMLSTESTDPKFLRYRHLIIEELKFARLINDNIQAVHGHYARVIAKNIELKQKLISEQMEYKKVLEEKNVKNAEDQQLLMSESYMEDLEFIRLRLNKINYLRQVTIRLLIYSKQALGDKELCMILKKCRTPYSIESFL